MNKKSEFHTSGVSVPRQRYKKKTHLELKYYPLSYLHRQQTFKHSKFLKKKKTNKQTFKHNIAVSVCIWHHHPVIKKHHNTKYVRAHSSSIAWLTCGASCMIIILIFKPPYPYIFHVSSSSMDTYSKWWTRGMM